MRKRSRTAAKLAGVVGALALMAGAVTLSSSANAAEVDFSYVMLDGSVVNVGTTEFPLFDPANPTSAGVVGVIDDVTGDFEGDLTIPARQTTQQVTDPIVGSIDLLVAITGEPVVGNIDPVTNEVEAATVIDVSMTFQQLTLDSDPTNPTALNIECTMSDISLELSSSPNGEPFDDTANPPTFAVADEGFTFPLPECAWNGTGTDPGASIVTLVRDGLIENLALPNSDTDAFLTFESGNLTPPTPPTPPSTAAPTTTTVAPAATVATPVRATPRVTG